ncbi:hypothetical protein CFC21_111992 [Triticum aestivum]|uniref:Uncharacterized protein n=2 Tax=Triticum aestivum TaxID=4565 RepID=A0A3B6U0D9_WHEAT|nr:hypothetical protein CFC21_111992 [Triticum aestivum]
MGFFTYLEASHASHEASKAGARCDERLVMHRVTDGGCLDDFNKAMEVCRGVYSPEASERDIRRGKAKRVVDVEACVKATAALRECFASNPKLFKHQYLRRIDEGLDQDTKPSEWQIYQDEKAIFRWWTDLRRS